jgi:hypothetical protein
LSAARVWTTVLGLAGLLALGHARALAAVPATTRVSYLAGGSVYVESGRLDGLAEGDTLAVLRDGAPLGRLVVRYLSSRRASCDTLGVSEMPRVGDAVRFTPRAVEPDSLAGGPVIGAGPAVSGAPEAGRARSRAARPLRGRVGGSYLNVDPQAGGGYTQPALDVRLDAALGSADFAADIRSRRTYLVGSDVPIGIGKVYRMSLSFHDDDLSRRVTLGRQTAPALAAVNLFDGVLASLARPRWGAGVFAGTQPDPVRFRLSGDIVEGGGYVDLRSRALSERRWSLVSGGVASFDHGNSDRNYLYIQGAYADPRLWASLAQQVDFYSGWKRTAGEPPISPSSTFLTARVQVTRILTLDAGYDTRRNVRLYRDRVTPETEFDDRYRNGAWVGGVVEPGGHLRLGADARFGSGGDGGNYHNWTTSGEMNRLPVLETDVRLRATRFVGDMSTEWLYSGGLAVRPFGQAQFGFNAGSRASQDVISRIETRMIWQGGDLSLGIGRGWYATISVERNQGGGTDEVQTYSGLSWLF